MGGKTKQSQRTKNNVRPSSSSRSAELLNNSVSLDTGIVTVGSGKVVPALFPSLATVNLEQGLSPEFQMCVKKLNKKDPITRAKALQELNDLMNNSNVEDVVAALPSWAHFYKTLTIDTDRKVRELTQLCHGSIMRVCGRRVAPQLRALLPAWLQAQYDEHAPAQAYAQNSLKSTFPDSKLPEVISFCKAEVIAHFLDNLMGNADAVINKKIEDPEERAAQQSRVVTSSLRGLEYLVPRLPAPAAAWLWAALAPLLQHNATWNFAAHDMYQVRAAWFGALGRILERFPEQFADKYGLRAMRLLLNAARDNNTLVAAQLWTCLLQFMHNIHDWHQYLEKKELLVKRILDVLETGGWGDAKHLSSMLLPILAHLPQDVLTKEFYEAFFKAVYVGLDKKTILSSKSERQSWITSLGECLRYLSIQQNEFVVEIVTSVHRTWIEKVLSTQLDTQTRNNLIKCSTANMTSIVKYWLKQSKEENSEKYDQLLRNFWQNVGSTVLLQICKCSTDLSEIEKLMDMHIMLVQYLKSTFMQETKKQQSIKFDKLDDDEPSEPDTRAAITPPCDESIVDRYKHNLDELVYKTISQYFEIAAKNQLSGPILTPLITLIVEFDSKGLFMSVARQLNVDSPYKLYECVLRNWLQDDTMRCNALMEIIFMMIKYLSDKEQDAVFDSFNQMSPCVEEWCLTLSAAHPHVRLPSARRWVRGVGGVRALHAVARRAVQHRDARAAALLLVCLADVHHGEPLVSAAGVSQVLAQVNAALLAVCSYDKPRVDSQETDLQKTNSQETDSTKADKQEAGGEADTHEAGSEADTHESDDDDEHSVESLARLAARLGTLLAHTSHALTFQFNNFVTRLFILNYYVPLGDGRLSADTWREVRSSWQDGLAALPSDLRARALHDVAYTMHSHLQTQVDDLNIKKLEQMLSLVPELFVRTSPAPLHSLVEFTRTLLGAKCPHADSCASACARAAAAADSAALRHDCVAARLNCLYDDDNDAIRDVVHHDRGVVGLVREDLVRHLADLLVRTVHLRNLLLQRDNSDDDDDSDEEESYDEDRVKTEDRVKSEDRVKTEDTWGDPLLSDEYFESALCRILYDYVVVASLYDGYKFWVHYDVIKKTKEKMDVLLCTVIGAISRTARDRLLTSLTQRAAARGYYWAFAHRYFVVNTTTPCDVSIDDEITTYKVLDITSGNGFFHMLQASNRFACSEMTQYKTAYVVMLRSWLLAHAAAGATQFVEDAVRCQADANIDVIVDAYYRNQATMLYERDVSKAPWSQVVSNVTVVEFLTLMVRQHGWEAPAHHWDFTTITLCSLLTSALKSRAAWDGARAGSLTLAALRLLRAVHEFVRALPAACQRRLPAPHLPALLTEWRDIFAPDLTATLYRYIAHVLESCQSMELSATAAAVLEALVDSVAMLRWSALGGAAASESRAGLTLQALARTALGSLVRAVHPPVKYLAYHLLDNLAKDMVFDDSLRLNQWSDDDERDEEVKERPQFLLDEFTSYFRSLQMVVEIALANVVVGEETCELVSMSDSHSMALGWLLLGEVQAHMGELAKGDLKQFYITIFRECKFTPPLLATALRLLPAELLAWAQDSADEAAAPPQFADYFLQVQPFSMSESRRSSALAALACRGVYRCVCGAGCGPARGWWGAAAPRAGRLLQRAVDVYVAPHAARAQLRDLQQRAAEVPDAEIRIVWSTREVVCAYSVDESIVELHVVLSHSHPLTPPRISTPDPHGASPSTHWLALYLAYQNGTLLNALKMWTQAVSARVEKAPQCYICYCRLHPSNGRLPRVPCHQCKNKFHNICLRKWFSTSNKSHCPLCRAIF